MKRITFFTSLLFSFFSLLIFLTGTAGCGRGDPMMFDTESVESVSPDTDVDVDDDGFDSISSGGTDCNDANAAINPDATEIPDGIDNNCDNNTDEDENEENGSGSGSGSVTTYYQDADSDGYGNDSITTTTETTGYITTGGDCDDSNASVNPGEEEICNDGLDNDCDSADSACALTGTHSLSEIGTTLNGALFYGEAANDFAGTALSSAGDVDGDTYVDILVGAPQNNATGAAYLIYGGPSLSGSYYFTACDGVDPSFTSCTKFNGGAASDYAGNALAGGDFNGDGYSDFMVGDDYYDDSSTDNGATYLIHGSATRYSGNTNSLESSGITLKGQSSSWTGNAISSGDVNGDGYADFVIGARGDDSAAANAGAAYLLYGKSENFPGGTTLSLGACSNTSIPEGLLLAPCAKFLGVATSDYFGIAVSATGDITGDGLDDIVVGAYKADCSSAADCGTASVIPGQSSSYSGSANSATINFSGEPASSDKAGTSVAEVGDVNSDGVGDFLVGASSNDSAARNSGIVYLMSGATAPSVDWADAYTTYTALSSFSPIEYTGEAEDSFLGSEVAPAGDFNGDGTPDFLVGSGSSGVYLIYGSSDLATAGIANAGLKLTFPDLLDGLNYTIAAAGDVNKDGYDDILIGTPMNSTTDSFAGAVYLIYGQGD